MADHKVVVAGLDGVPPELLFDESMMEGLPNLKYIIDEGCYGPLKSTVPAITVPAWASMMTSRNPGALGMYGLRNRINHSYDDYAIANSKFLVQDTVWDILSRNDKRSIVVGFPPSYPPKRINGIMVSCFLTPDHRSPYVYPAKFKKEIESLVGGYPFDIYDFRTEDKEYLLQQLFEMAEKHFDLICHLIRRDDWDFFMFVEIGPDRLHHGFWKFYDPDHIKHDPDSPYKGAVLKYYQYIDKRIGQLLTLIDDNTSIMVVSDHGAKKLDGCICVNEWLMKEGYLKLRKKPEGISRLEKEDILWKRTVAWGEGGYYGRLFLNVKGREPNGKLSPGDYEKVRTELKKGLEGIKDENGNPIGTKVFRPEELYSSLSGVPPDLMVYFGDLDWRSVGTVGWDTIWTRDNDTGPDDANHSQHGVFALKSPATGKKGLIEDLNILDIAPTALKLMGMAIPDNMEGKAIL